jgi:VanZ family protein
VILALTSVPGAVLPQASNFPDADKVVHFGLYAVLAFLSARGARQHGIGSWSGIVFGIAMFAALDEWHQQFIPGRSMDVRDWAADVTGALLGVWIFGMVRRHREQTT